MTKSLDPSAWWIGIEETEEETRPIVISEKETIFAFINRTYKGKQGIQALLDIIRKKSERRCLPCKVDKTGDKHKYQVYGWKPFRLRCAVKQCSHNLYDSDALRYIAELVTGRHVTKQDIGME